MPAAIPKGLGNRGKALWRSVVATLSDGWELDERGLEILALAAHQADDVAKLETLIKKRGLMVKGSTGQPVLNPAIAEARQGRLAVNRLIGQLALPDEEEEPRSSASKRAQKAARTRWNRRDRQRAG